MREHSNTSSRALKHEHDTSAARTRSREHSSITSNRALEYSSTRARARRALEHQRSGTTNTRALEHSPTLEYSNTGTSTRTLGHEHEHSNMSTRAPRAIVHSSTRALEHEHDENLTTLTTFKIPCIKCEPPDTLLTAAHSTQHTALYQVETR